MWEYNLDTETKFLLQKEVVATAAGYVNRVNIFLWEMVWAKSIKRLHVVCPINVPMKDFVLLIKLNGTSVTLVGN